jgi:hypothetical protein
MTIALSHEVLRVSLFAKLPPAYMASPESAKPAILALGSVLQYAEGMFDLMAFVVMFGLGFSAFALAILNLRVVAHWLGWALLILAVGVGLIAYPLGYFGVASAGMLVLPGMLVFFVWLTSIGIVLLRWQPQKDSPNIASDAHLMQASG